MSKTIHIVHDYPVSPDKLWEIAIDWECLKKAVEGLITFYNLPAEPIHQGQTIKTDVSILGITPKSPWTMEVLEYDPDNKLIRSHEYGGAVKQWDHTLHITETQNGSRLTDTIIIDAGAMTWLYVMWGRFMYSSRHKPRLQMLGLETA